MGETPVQRTKALSSAQPRGEVIIHFKSGFIRRSCAATKQVDAEYFVSRKKAIAAGPFGAGGESF